MQLCAPEQCHEGDAAVRAGMYGGVYEGRIAVGNVFGTESSAPTSSSSCLTVKPRSAFSRRRPSFPTSCKSETTTAKVAPGDMRIANPPGYPPVDVPLVPFTYQSTEDLNLIPFPSTNLSGPLVIVVGSDAIRWRSTRQPIRRCISPSTAPAS